MLGCSSRDVLHPGAAPQPSLALSESRTAQPAELLLGTAIALPAPCPAPQGTVYPLKARTGHQPAWPSLDGTCLPSTSLIPRAVMLAWCGGNPGGEGVGSR